MPTNTRESGLESLIVNYLVERNGYEQGASADYNKEFAVDETRLFRFLWDTQPKAMQSLGVADSDIKRTQFLSRLAGEIAKRGGKLACRNRLCPDGRLAQPGIPAAWPPAL